MNSNANKTLGAAMILLGLVATNLFADEPRADHHLTVVLHPQGHRLEALDRLVVSGHVRRRLDYRLGPEVAVSRVRLGGRPVSFSFREGRLSIPAPPSASAIHLEIEYAGIYDDPVPEAPLNTDNPGLGVTGTIDPRGTMLLAGAGWYPDGIGRQRFSITVDAPEGIVAVTSGDPRGQETAGGRTLSHWSVAAPLRGISLVAGRYTMESRRVGAITVATYFSDALQTLSPDYLESAGHYLQLYSDLFGPYAFRQFAVVENFFPTGYGFPGFTLMGSRVLRLPFIVHTSLGHEVAHCWWGNGVLVDPSEGNWSEGLTTYVADYLYQERRGEGRAGREQWLRNYASLVDPQSEFSLARFAGRTDPASRAIGYDKAAMVFHMLRRTMGEKAFWSALRTIYARHRFQAVAWSDLEAVFEETSHQDLKTFFRQWVFRSGAPRLALEGVTARATEDGYIIEGQLSQSMPNYALHTDMAVETARQRIVQPMEIRGRRSPFSVRVDAEPRRLVVDPDVDLFRRLAAAEVPPTINRLKTSDSVCVVVADALGEPALALARKLALALGLEKADVGLAMQLDPRRQNGRDRIYVGMPADPPWSEEDRARFSMDRTRIYLLGESHAGAGTSFFGVFADARDPEHLAAVFVPDDVAHAERIIRKIPHYGKYSYLLFEGAENRVKGTWPAENGPLQVRWKPGLIRVREGDRP